MIQINKEDLRMLIFIAERYINAFETSISQGQRADRQAFDFYDKAKRALPDLQKSLNN